MGGGLSGIVQRIDLKEGSLVGEVEDARNFEGDPMTDGPED